MPKYCVYCGNPLKESDKFCIICGKPILQGIPDKEKTKLKITPEDSSRINSKKNTITEFTDDDEFLEGESNSKKKIKKGKNREATEKPLPYEVKEQMILYIDYNDIQLNKQLLIDKLKELQKSLKDPKYEYDEEYKDTINVKLDAIKTLISEFKTKEDEIKGKMEEPFIVQRIQNDIETKIFQLKNLTKEYKLHNVDKDSFEKLRDKYKEEKESLEEERENLTSGIKLWIKELKLEKTEINSERNLNKGRFHAKELPNDAFKNKEKEFETRLKKIDVKIKTLEELVK
ncbi:MAG: hypothetical protein EU532_09905 [Promethearchaeota archaeon]|nr:MAG: hypothetical protein EU532_09905 [Candidatus Lokiarchaeota archaeon]